MAYKYGDEWHQKNIEYIKGNIDFAIEYIEKNIPGLRVMRQDATYLLWVDFNGLGLSSREQKVLIEDKAKLWLNEGKSFGPEAEGFWRINLACPRSIIEKALKQLEENIKDF